MIISTGCGKKHSTAANHKKQHARNSAFCSTCDGPFYAKDITAINRHYRNMHPEIKVPLKMATGKNMALKMMPEPKKTPRPLISKKQRCKLCRKTYLLGRLHRHMQKMHSSKKMQCLLTNCDYETTRIESLRLHCKSTHNNLRFPEIRQFAFWTNTAQPIGQENVSLILFYIFTCDPHSSHFQPTSSPATSNSLETTSLEAVQRPNVSFTF